MATETQELWAKRVERWQDSGLTAKGFAAEMGIILAMETAGRRGRQASQVKAVFDEKQPQEGVGCCEDARLRELRRGTAGADLRRKRSV